MSKEMNAFFREIWDEREDEEGYVRCFETGREMHGSRYRSLTTCYHHVLEQGNTKFPQYAFLKENIVILHPDVHIRYHNNPDSCPKVKALREKLLSLHYENKLEV